MSISGVDRGEGFSFSSNASMQSKSTVLLMHEDNGQEVTSGAYKRGGGYLGVSIRNLERGKGFS